MVIDSHLHVLKWQNFDKVYFDGLAAGVSSPEDTPVDTLVNWLKAAGVERGVIMGQEMTRVWKSSCGEQYVLECVRRYPSFFVALASVEPVDIHGRFNKPGLDYFEKAVKEEGFKGLLLTPPYGRFRSDDPTVYPFYDKAVELNVVVQFHHCAQLGPLALAPFKYTDPVSLNNILLAFPDLRVVVEHLNYPRYEELFFMMASDSSVYADIAMTYDRPYILAWNLVKAKEFGVLDRVMYASDYWASGEGVYSKNPEQDMKRWIGFVKTGLNQIAEKTGWPLFTKEEIDGILHKNAARLYDLDLSKSC